MKKRIVSILLVVAMVIGWMPATAFAEETPAAGTGACGDNLNWTLADGVLTISGEGAMYDYHWLDNTVPWDLNEVKKVVFADDCAVTYIGEQAFMQCPQLESVKLPDTVTEIGYMAFYGCEKLSSVTLSEGLTTIGAEAFCMCTALKEIAIPANVTEIGSMAFAYSGIQKVTVAGAAPSLGDRVFAGCTFVTYVPLQASWGGDEQWQNVSMLLAPGTIQGAVCKIVDPEALAEKGKTVYKRLDAQGNPVTQITSLMSVTETEPGHILYWPCDEKVDYYLAYQGTTGLHEMENASFMEPSDALSWMGWAIYGADLDPEQTYIIKAFDGDGNLLDAEMVMPKVDTTAPKVSGFTGTLTPDGALKLTWKESQGDTMMALWFLEEPDGADGYLTIDEINEAGDTVVDTTNISGTHCTYTIGEVYVREYGLTAGTELSMLILDLCGNEEVYTCTLKEPEPVITQLAPADGSLVRGEYVQFTVSAADDYGISRVELAYSYEDAVLGTVAPESHVYYEPDGTVSVERTFVIGTAYIPDGSVSVTATVTNTSGNTAVLTQTYILDNVVEPVTGLQATAGTDGISVSWSPSADPLVTGYIVERTADIDNPDSFVPCSWLDKTAVTYWDDNDLVPGTTYRYRVVAVTGPDGAGMSDYAYVDCEFTGVPADEVLPEISDVWPATADAVVLCHDGTLKLSASDDVALSHGEIYYTLGENAPVLIGTVELSGTSQVASIVWDCSDLVGQVTLTYKVYDQAGNCAQRSETVIVRPYTAPAQPQELTAEAGLRSAALAWTYSGDLYTLKQFKVYSCDSDGENAVLLAAVKSYAYSISELTEGTHYFMVTAEDIYGAESTGAVVAATVVATETVAPSAVIQNTTQIGVTGTAVTFSGAGSSDNDAITAYNWDFGDGAAGAGVNATHTYDTAGTYTVTLTVVDRSGNADSATTQITVYDVLGDDATHAVLTVTVKNGHVEGTPPVENATVTVYSDGFESAALTDASGTAQLVVPKGAHTMTVVKSGFNGKLQQLDVTGQATVTVYLAAAGIDVVGGKLTVETMTYEEIVEAGIDVTDPANQHVVKQAFTIRFQPAPELKFDIDLDIKVNGQDEIVDSDGFGWHVFTPDPVPSPDPDPSNPSGPNIVTPEDWVTPNYTVGVFPVGESAFMVIHGQSHWLKEMFNVELIVFNTSYAEDITGCAAALELPEGLSLAAMLDGAQHEKVTLGLIDYIGKENGTSVRQVNWYVRGDKEGSYNLTAAVTGAVSGTPFEKRFTADKAIHVYAGSALKLTITVPESAYSGKDYVIKFALTNVSDRDIYNLTFGLDGACQFTAEYLSDGAQGEVREILDNKDFEGNMTYGIPTLEPGDSFNLVFKTKFLYKQGFVEWATGKIPGLEVGYQVKDFFVTTLEGSTTEIPVEVVLEKVEKDSFGQWIWDETLGALKENAKEAVIEFIDDKIFKGIPVVEKGVQIFEISKDIKEEVNGITPEYSAAVSVSEGVRCVDKSSASTSISPFMLRRSVQPGVLVYTDAKRYEISADGRTMTLLSPGKLYVLRNGETYDADGNVIKPEITVTTHYVDADGKLTTFTRTLLAAEGLDADGNPTGGDYVPGLQEARNIVMENVADSVIAVPAPGEIVSVTFPAYMIGANGEILLGASNAVWSVTDADGAEVTEGLCLADGVLTVDSTAKAGAYTVKLSLEGTDVFKAQMITLTSSNDDDDDDDDSTTAPTTDGDEGSDDSTTAPTTGGDEGSDDSTTTPTTGGDEGSDDSTTTPTTDGDEGSDDSTTAPTTGGNDGDDDNTTVATTGNEGGNKVPPTGDEMPVQLWTVAMVVSLMGLALILLESKKKYQ